MTLTDLVRSLRARRDAAIESYSAAVARVAGGGKVPIETLEQLLVSAGKSPEAFEQDVERHNRRREAFAHLKDADECAQLRKELDKRMTAAQAALDRATAIFNDEANEFQMQLVAIKDREQSVQENRRYLEDSADPKVIAEVDAAHKAFAEASDARHAAYMEVERVGKLVKQAEQTLVDVRAGKIPLIHRQGYVGPETTEKSAERVLQDKNTALVAAQDRHKAAEEAYESAEHQLAEARKKLLIP